MSRNAVLLTGVVLACITFLSWANPAMLRAAAVLPVHNVDTGIDFASIYDAVSANSTVDGNTIMVDSGTYSESVIIDKSLSILGQNRETTMITRGNGDVFNVTADNVTISGFTLVGDGANSGNLLSISNASNVLVSENDIVNNTVSNGVLLLWSTAVSLRRNRFLNNLIGVSGYLSSNCSIEDNVFRGDDEGMYFSGFSDSVIRRNSISDVAFGVFFQDSSNHNLLAENNMTRNLKTAVRMGDSMGNIILRNNISECGYFGLRMKYNSDYNYIVENNIFENDPAGLRIEASKGNYIYHNNFYNNTLGASVYQLLQSSWDNGYISGGNYWEGYNGSDVLMGTYQNVSGPDGLIDTAYYIDPANFDRFPLAGPFSSYHVFGNLSIDVVSNSTIDGFEYLASNNTLRLDVSNLNSDHAGGFARICIPHDVMSEPYNVSVNDRQPEYLNSNLFDNSTHQWLYISYSQSPSEIAVAPEFPLAILLITLLATFLFAACVNGSRKWHINI